MSRIPMKIANAVAEILKREGTEFLIGYPVNPIIEADIRTITVRQERIGLHMCDAIAKVTSGDRIGVFAMQHGPRHRKCLWRRRAVLW
jgi:thiamine pyrophosphate-dependent acetolactate synthase large subunit-like protein